MLVRRWQHLWPAVPSCAVPVVGAASAWVGEDGVGGDDEAVALQPGGVGDGRLVRRERVWMRSVRVVDLDELVEAFFAVDAVLGLLEDLVGRGRGKVGPLEVGWGRVIGLARRRDRLNIGIIAALIASLSCSCVGC